MSFETDMMRNLSQSLRQTEGLKYTLKEFNNNINFLKALTYELMRANELKEIELGLKDKSEYSCKRK